jgi:hypothetical protein
MEINQNELANEVMRAFLAAMRGDDKVAGDHLRSMGSKIAEQFTLQGVSPIFPGAKSPPGRDSASDRGEQEPEVTGEEP